MISQIIGLAALIFPQSSITTPPQLATNGPPGFLQWPGGVPPGGPSEKGSFSNHAISISNREKDGRAEVHEKIVDVMIVQSGEATLLVGGKSVDPVATGRVRRRASRSRAVSHGGAVQIYPGIDIDVPTAKGEKHTTPDDVRAATEAAFGVGANGAVLSREYHEMWLANLSAAGETTRRYLDRTLLFRQSASRFSSTF